MNKHYSRVGDRYRAYEIKNVKKENSSVLFVFNKSSCKVTSMYDKNHIYSHAWKYATTTFREKSNKRKKIQYWQLGK